MCKGPTVKKCEKQPFFEKNECEDISQLSQASNLKWPTIKKNIKVQSIWKFLNQKSWVLTKFGPKKKAWP